MAAMISANILEKTDFKSCAMMSVENGDTIADYKDKTPIVKMPKKGGTGLNDSFADLCDLIDATVKGSSELESIKERICY